MEKRPKMSKMGEMALKALREAGKEALEEHRRMGVPAVYMKDGKMVYLLPDGREVTEPPERKNTK